MDKIEAEFKEDELPLTANDKTLGEVSFLPSGYWSANDIWKAAGSPARKKYENYQTRTKFLNLRSAYAKRFPDKELFIFHPNRKLGIMLCTELALDYAAYLNNSVYLWVLQVARERIEEYHDPELGIARSRQRAIKNFSKKGKSEGWIKDRLDSIDSRNDFTETLQEHGVQSYGYGKVTNGLYKGLIGHGAKELAKQRGLSSSSNLRDSMTREELRTVAFTEQLTGEVIRSKNAHGNDECYEKALNTSREVGDLIKRLTQK